MMKPRKSHSKPSTGSQCEMIRELIPAYSIGATDPEETRLVEALLPECPEAATELADYYELAEALLYMTPADTQLSEADSKRIWQGVERHDPRPAPSPIIPLPQPPAPARPNWPLQVALMGSAAAMILLSLLNVYWLGQNQQLQVSQAQLQANQQQLVALITSPRPTEPTITTANTSTTTVTVAEGGLLHRRDLNPTQAGSNAAKATLLWSAESNVASLYAVGLAELPPDEVYQLWLVRGEQILSLGTFTLHNGVGTMIFESPASMEPGDTIGISPEPEGGSPQPTHDHVVIGQV